MHHSWSGIHRSNASVIRTPLRALRRAWLCARFDRVTSASGALRPSAMGLSWRSWVYYRASLLAYGRRAP